ncbi:hypothetical protein D8Z79_015415 [Escherichia fergusonii]|uniref:hypothetical protein n=1 Tax=Escherichia fergusonii TaxID=564 RepID=UPI000F67B555|nr:hypothetical protein [Escherichia fergusonii]QCZ33110.1 hypothetical protein D8Z79_015415 [Escherichia fergusonii]
MIPNNINFANDRMILDNINQPKKSSVFHSDGNTIASYVRDYFKNPGALDKEIYKLISIQIINIYTNCPALLKNNNFSATICLYGYRIPLNIMNSKSAYPDSAKFINADSGTEMNNSEKSEFLEGFKNNQQNNVYITKTQMYHTIINYIKKLPNLKSYQFDKDKLKLFKESFDDNNFYSNGALEDKLIEIITKVGRSSINALSNENTVVVGEAELIVEQKEVGAIDQDSMYQFSDE